MDESTAGVPTGVKIISVLYYIGAVIELLLALALFIGAGAIASKIPLLGALGSGLFIAIGVVLLGFAVLSFFVGRGLWKVQKWSRIVAIIFAVLGLLLAVLGMVQGQIASNVLGLVISLAVGGYLLFSSDVKSAFA